MSKTLQLKKIHSRLQQKSDDFTEINKTLKNIKSVINHPETFEKAKKRANDGYNNCRIYGQLDNWQGWKLFKGDEYYFWNNRNNEKNKQYIEGELKEIFKDAGYSDFKITWSCSCEAYDILGKIDITW